MPGTYNDAWATYNDPSVLYNGIVLREHVTLIVDGVDVTDELDDEGLSVHTGSHGNSLGTLDAVLDEPAVLPVVGDPVDYYVGLERLYRGTVKTVDADERHDGSLKVSIGCQDAGPPGGVPGPAPFAVSDSPSPPATREYVSLSRQTRTTEGGAPKTTYQLVIEEDGLRPNMNVAVTSARFGLVAAELEIKEMVATRRFRDQPRYTLVLGDPRVSLVQVVRNAEVPDGSITETKISDGAISTPKLQALVVTTEKLAAGSVTTPILAAGAATVDKLAAGAVTTEKLAATATIKLVTNDGATVVIDAAGITVTGGDITVENPAGVVIIDGTSEILNIVATGELSSGAFTGPANPGWTGSVDLSTGLTYFPIWHGHLLSAAGAHPIPNIIFGNNGSAIDWWGMRAEVVNTNQTRVHAEMATTRTGSIPAGFRFRFVVNRKQAF